MAASPGFNSLMRYLPELELGIAIFGNSNGAGDIAEILCWHLIDGLLSVPTPERLDWTALQREYHEKSKQEEKNRLQSKPLEPEFAMSVPLLQYAGKYQNVSYHDLILEVKDGKLWADCSVRNFGFVLSFDHVYGDTFVVEIRDFLDDSKRNVGAEFQLETNHLALKLIGMDIFNRYMSGGISGIFGSSPEQYWGTLVDEVGTPSQMFTRLVLSIYEFLKATAEDRAPQMLPHGAQPYLTPEMFANLLDALSIGPLNFDDSDTKNFQITTLDQAFLEFYTAMNLAHNHIARPNVPGSKMPLLRRSGLGAYLLLLIRTDPPAMQQKLTALLSEQKRLFLDPFTESAFVHTTIPLSCFPASPDPGSVATLAASSAKWLEKRTALIARANAAAAGGNPDLRALLAQYQSQSSNVMGARMQAAGNIGAANAAYAMAMAERQKALALNRAMETQDIYSDYTYKWQQAPGGIRGFGDILFRVDFRVRRLNVCDY
ncbi:uncharacterized protein K441DRAFT_681132 [Cenococcum geophilum 1.58]|uniref:uncharacterized protein n=1 Tax=Cenococcum geophilum 1.58 TaxID=794803 RepID=UPI00358F65D8|nr:hypothetical protein K441DRAFT_681132 [Cenococcum geophilum 1.58]